MRTESTQEPKEDRGSRLLRGYKFLVKLESLSAILMLLAAIVALVIANSPLFEPFHHLLRREIFIGTNSFGFSLSIEMLINDVLMAVFFLVVGIEIKRELLVGELSDPRKAALPILAAIGGMAAPALIYTFINMLPGESYFAGWGVPVATDIAFAVGMLSLLGSKVPSGVKVFLLALAIVDDLGAIVVIALFYGQAPDLLWLVISIVVVASMVVANRLRVRSTAAYLGLGALLLVMCFYSGIHPTVAGVITAFVLPGRSADKDSSNSEESKGGTLLQSPLDRVEHMFAGVSTYIVLPLFALANAGVRVVGVDPMLIVSNHAAVGAFMGLLIGKPLGVITMCVVAVKANLAKLPQGVNWKYVVGLAMLTGIGFTMAIFVANLAFEGSPQTVNMVKAGILLASVAAGLLGYVYMRSSVHKKDPPLS